MTVVASRLDTFFMHTQCAHTGEWITPTVTGDRPPPIYDFTLTSVTNSTAVMFGGNTTNGKSNDVYIINFTKTSVVSTLISIINH